MFTTIDPVKGTVRPDGEPLKTLRRSVTAAAAVNSTNLWYQHKGYSVGCMLLIKCLRYYTSYPG